MTRVYATALENSVSMESVTYRSRWESWGGHNASSESHSTPQTEIKHEEVTSTKRIRGSTHFVHSASIQGYMDLVYIRTVMVCQDINYTLFHILLPQLKYDICGHQKKILHESRT